MEAAVECSGSNVLLLLQCQGTPAEITVLKYLRDNAMLFGIVVLHGLVVPKYLRLNRGCI